MRKKSQTKDLASFLEKAAGNVRLALEVKPAAFRKLSDIDAAFLELARNLNYPSNVFAAAFVQQAHAAYRSAVFLMLSGQPREIYPQLRSSIENALYCLYFHHHPDAFEQWAERQDSQGARKWIRKTLKTGKLMALLKEDALVIHGIIGALYEETIDWGGHPNVLALAATLAVEQREEGKVTFHQAYLDPRPSETMDAAFVLTARVGLAALSVVQLAFKERSRIMGLDERIRSLMKGL